MEESYSILVKEDIGNKPTSFSPLTTDELKSSIGGDEWIEFKPETKKNRKSRHGDSPSESQSSKKSTEDCSNVSNAEGKCVENKPEKCKIHKSNSASESGLSKEAPSQKVKVHRGSESKKSKNSLSAKDFENNRSIYADKTQISKIQKATEVPKDPKSSPKASKGLTILSAEDVKLVPEKTEVLKDPKPTKRSKKSRRKPTIDLIEKVSINERPLSRQEIKSSVQGSIAVGPIASRDLEETSKSDTTVEPTATLAQLAQERAKCVLDIAVPLFMAQVLLFLQRRNCEVGSDVISNIVNDQLLLDDLSECDIKFEFGNLTTEYYIAISIAAYSSLVAIIVILHASFVDDHAAPNVQDIFRCTDRIPILDSLLEIPICMWHAPFMTTFLWANFLACCVGIIFFVLEYQEATLENANLTAFLLNAFLVAFDLYRITGDVAQYYVTYTEAKKGTRERERMYLENIYATLLKRRSTWKNVSEERRGE